MKTYFEPTIVSIGKQRDLSMLSYIKQVHTEAIELLNAKINKQYILNTNAYNIIELEYSNRLSTSAGKAYTKRGTDYGKIKLNYRLFKDFKDNQELKKNLKNTYIHELAHVLANRLHGCSQGHNSRWRNIFKIMGGNGETYHTMEVNHLRPSHLKRVFKATCNCRTHNLNRTQYNKAKLGILSCTLCKGKLNAI